MRNIAYGSGDVVAEHKNGERAHKLKKNINHQGDVPESCFSLHQNWILFNGKCGDKGQFVKRLASDNDLRPRRNPKDPLGNDSSNNVFEESIRG